jgi:hypothetical protein
VLGERLLPVFAIAETAWQPTEQAAQDQDDRPVPKLILPEHERYQALVAVRALERTALSLAPIRISAAFLFE